MPTRLRRHLDRARCARARTPIGALLACALVGASIAAAGTAPATGAGASTVVTATVPSSTNLTATGCAAGTAGSTSLGVVLPGSSAVSTSDCHVVFGSSNDTASLRVRQTDASGSAMYAPATGARDTTYNGTGLNIDASVSGNAYDTVVLDDGRVLVAGGDGSNIRLARYLADGTPDLTFNGTGRRTIDLHGCNDSAFSVDLDADGNILIAGSTQLPDGFLGACFTLNSFVMRLLDDGTNDPAFAGGTQREMNHDAFDALYSVVDLPNGTIAAVGQVAFDTSAYLLDDAGTVTQAKIHDIVAFQTDRAFEALALADGKVVITGLVDNGSRNTLVARLTGTLDLDATFNGSGFRNDNLGGDDTGYGIAQASDGKLIVAGTANGNASVTRYAENGGSIDTTFGTSGTTTVDFGSASDAVGRMHLEGDGRILAAGGSFFNEFSGTSSSNLGVLRLLPDGALDTTFSNDGWHVEDVTPGTNDLAVGVGNVVDGAVVLGGTSNGRVMTMKLAGPTIPQWLDGTRDWNQGTTGSFGACLRATTNATSTWTVNATCPAADGGGTDWQAVPTGATEVANSATNQTAAAVDLRFGLRVPATQAPGSYIAPITFEVVAPA